MPNSSAGNDLGILELLKTNGSGPDALTALAAKTPAHDPGEPAAAPEKKINEVISRIMQLTGSDVRRDGQKQNIQSESVARTVAEASSTAGLGSGAKASSSETNAGIKDDCDFVPMDPASIRDAGLTDSEVEALILKYLLARGDSSGRDVAEQIRMPFFFVETLLR